MSAPAGGLANRELKAKGVLVVALDLPTSHQSMQPARKGDDCTGHMLTAINDILLDMLAAVARKDYEDRRRRQKDGVLRKLRRIVSTQAARPMKLCTTGSRLVSTLACHCVRPPRPLAVLRSACRESRLI